MNISGVTINPERNRPDFGEDDWSALAAIDNAVVLADRVFVPRGSDLKARDRFEHQNKTYWVTGDAEWDMNHPMSGIDMGYVELKTTLEGRP